MPKTNNPLAQFFRQPAIYVRLPSKGAGWPEGSIDLPANGELPVYPMTAIDEITYRTPDALFNGQAVVAVIQSCVPNILDAWQMPNTDLDAILVAIRIASYGHSMDIDTTCPACETETAFGLDLRSVIDGLRSADYKQPLKIGDLTLVFRPLSYKEVTENSSIQFEQQKTLQMLGDQELAQESKVEQLNIMMRRLIESTVNVLSQSIGQIRTPDALVTDQEQISEFMNHCDRDMFNRIKDHAVKLREDSELKPLKMSCPNCQHKYEQSFTLDMARFFDSAS